MYRYIANISFENQAKSAEKVGIAPETFSRIVNQKQNCSKVVAYAITKYINASAEIENFFERVD